MLLESLRRLLYMIFGVLTGKPKNYGLRPEVYISLEAELVGARQRLTLLETSPARAQVVLPTVREIFGCPSRVGPFNTWALPSSAVNFYFG